jgi:hypothetical protein
MAMFMGEQKKRRRVSLLYNAPEPGRPGGWPLSPIRPPIRNSASWSGGWRVVTAGGCQEGVRSVRGVVIPGSVLPHPGPRPTPSYAPEAASGRDHSPARRTGTGQRRPRRRDRLPLAPRPLDGGGVEPKPAHHPLGPALLPQANWSPSCEMKCPPKHARRSDPAPNATLPLRGGAIHTWGKQSPEARQRHERSRRLTLESHAEPHRSKEQISEALGQRQPAEPLEAQEHGARVCFQENVPSLRGQVSVVRQSETGRELQERRAWFTWVGG